MKNTEEPNKYFRIPLPYSLTSNCTEVLWMFFTKMKRKKKKNRINKKKFS